MLVSVTPAPLLPRSLLANRCATHMEELYPPLQVRHGQCICDALDDPPRTELLVSGIFITDSLVLGWLASQCFSNSGTMSLSCPVNPSIFFPAPGKAPTMECLQNLYCDMIMDSNK